MKRRNLPRIVVGGTTVLIIALIVVAIGVAHAVFAASGPSAQAASGAHRTNAAMATMNDCQWTQYTSTTPNNEPRLLSVDALSAKQVWAVGNYFDPTTGSSRTLTESFNGATWSVIPSLNPGGFNVLQRVEGISASNVWAVGQTFQATYQTLVERWNGATWNVVNIPNVTGGVDFTGISADSASDVWIVGGTGDATTGTPDQPLLVHWNGSAWSTITVPAPGNFENITTDVAAISSSNVWLIGTYENSGYAGAPLFEHWNGSTWSVVSVSGLPNYASPSRIVARTGNDIWVVGQSVPDAKHSQTWTEHWNGSAWSLIASPNQGSSGSGLDDVVALSSTEVLAVGSYFVGGPIYYSPLIMKWNGSSYEVEWVLLGDCQITHPLELHASLWRDRHRFDRHLGGRRSLRLRGPRSRSEAELYPRNRHWTDPNTNSSTPA